MTTKLNPNMPPLPAKAKIDPSLGDDACNWLNEYIAFSQKMSPRAYEDFHEAVGLFVLSTVAARRLAVHVGQKSILTNLYISLCALTSFFAKSTTANLARNVLEAAQLHYLLAPNDATPQAFISDLAGKLPPNYSKLPPMQQDFEEKRLTFSGQKGWHYSEFGMKIKALMKENGTMADFRGLFRVLDDGHDKYSYNTVSRGRETIEKPYVPLLADMTPEDIRPYAGQGNGLWRDGFWPRFVFITPPGEAQPNKERFPDQKLPIPKEITDPLIDWNRRLGKPKVSIKPIYDAKGQQTGEYEVDKDDLHTISLQLGSEVYGAFYNYHDSLMEIANDNRNNGNLDLIGNYARFAEKAMRVAILLASVSGLQQVSIKHWARAQAITERWRSGLHNLYDQVNEAPPNEEAKQQEKIIKAIEKLEAENKPTTASGIYRLLRSLSPTLIDEMCKRMVKAGMINSKLEKLSNGRTGMVYKIN